MALLDMSAAFDGLVENVNVITRGPGAYVEGEWIEGTLNATLAQATVLPLTEGEKAEHTVEGGRSEDRKKFYIQLDLPTLDEETLTETIRVSYKGATYKAYAVNDYFEMGGFITVYGELER